MEKIKFIFIGQIYQHIINYDGDWDGYYTEWKIEANSLEEADKIYQSKFNAYTEPQGIDRFYNPVSKKWHDAEKFDSMVKAINEKIVEITRRSTFFDREMPYYGLGA